MSTPIGGLTNGVCVRRITIKIQKCVLLAHFVVFPMTEFDAIFVLDWMMRHRALIDYRRKSSNFDAREM